MRISEQQLKRIIRESLRKQIKKKKIIESRQTRVDLFEGLSPEAAALRARLAASAAGATGEAAGTTLGVETIAVGEATLGSVEAEVIAAESRGILNLVSQGWQRVKNASGLFNMTQAETSTVSSWGRLFNWLKSSGPKVARVSGYVLALIASFIGGFVSANGVAQWLDASYEDFPDFDSELKNHALFYLEEAFGIDLAGFDYNYYYPLFTKLFGLEGSDSESLEYGLAGKTAYGSRGFKDYAEKIGAVDTNKTPWYKFFSDDEIVPATKSGYEGFKGLTPKMVAMGKGNIYQGKSITTELDKKFISKIKSDLKVTGNEGNFESYTENVTPGDIVRVSLMADKLAEVSKGKYGLVFEQQPADIREKIEDLFEGMFLDKEAWLAQASIDAAKVNQELADLTVQVEADIEEVAAEAENTEQEAASNNADINTDSSFKTPQNIENEGANLLPEKEKEVFNKISSEFLDEPAGVSGFSSTQDFKDKIKIYLTDKIVGFKIPGQNEITGVPETDKIIDGLINNWSATIDTIEEFSVIGSSFFDFIEIKKEDFAVNGNIKSIDSFYRFFKAISEATGDARLVDSEKEIRRLIEPDESEEIVGSARSDSDFLDTNEREKLIDIIKRLMAQRKERVAARREDRKETREKPAGKERRQARRAARKSRRADNKERRRAGRSKD